MNITSSEFPSLYVGDQPADAAVLEVDGDLSSFPNAEVKLRKPDGTLQTITGITSIVGESEIHVALGGGYFSVPGLWSLQVVLSGPGIKQSLPPVGFVVEAEDGWLDLYTARNEWRDAPDDDVSLYRILQVAKLQVLEFAPSMGTPAVEVPGLIWDDPELPLVPSNWVEDPDNPGFYFVADEPLPRPPANFVQAQRLQCRNIWNAAKTDPSGGIGDTPFEIRPFPMDNIVKQIIRPKRAIPYFGRA